jgi:hypothetical protein
MNEHQAVDQAHVPYVVSFIGEPNTLLQMRP